MIISIISAGLIACTGVKIAVRKTDVKTAMTYVLFFRRVFLSAVTSSHHRDIASVAIIPHAAAKLSSPITAASMNPIWTGTPTVVAIMNLPGPNNFLNIASFLLSLVFICKLWLFHRYAKEFAKSLLIYFNMYVNTCIKRWGNTCPTFWLVQVLPRLPLKSVCLSALQSQA